MIRFSGYVVTLFFALVAFVASLNAQSSNLQYQVANMVEDQRLMMEQMRGLLAEMDEMRRENARLRALVEDFESDARRQSGNYATVAQVNELVRKTVASLEARDEVVQKEVTAMVNRELSKFAKEVQKSLGSITAAPKIDKNVKTVFDTSGVPENGIPYTVQPGESISSIAKKLNSRPDWIQNINKISDPRLLQVGQTIFVPQE
ncbi:lytic transglycosylase [Pelagicoccus mobilis]|uniref:LysM peptidoglycan-binding domain-containing protein n=1 Tax=Pelagicoccus mobilis TaxID=415221 RepID=A0A934RYF6_9BACT|nr:LysM peptidoglycan-binding domain-containing protein [Pelagicoccus mobilis]MBK1876642.1 LysM peptidoglycan-binding domain-containing protein [Pelagicoccus mobilis]